MNARIVTVAVEATPFPDQPFTPADLIHAVRAACLEVHPVTDGDPVVPVVTVSHRPVYILAGSQAMCVECIDATWDPPSARAAILRRDDARHCLSCDYHAPDHERACSYCAEINAR